MRERGRKRGRTEERERETRINNLRVVCYTTRSNSHESSREIRKNSLPNMTFFKLNLHL